jgi:hypothetical protein
MYKKTPLNCMSIIAIQGVSQGGKSGLSAFLPVYSVRRRPLSPTMSAMLPISWGGCVSDNTMAHGQVLSSVSSVIRFDLPVIEHSPAVNLAISRINPARNFAAFVIEPCRRRGPSWAADSCIWHRAPPWGQSRTVAAGDPLCRCSFDEYARGNQKHRNNYRFSKKRFHDPVSI